MRLKTLIATLLASLSLSAFALPVQWTSASGGNDHWYDYVLLPTGGGFNWDGAAADSLTRSHLGLAGYMATVTSMAEHNFIFNNVSRSTAWLGGNDRDLEGNWKWVAGPEAGTVFYIAGAGAQPGFSFWSFAEPNDCCNGEDDLAINWDGNTGAWNDFGVPSFPDSTLGYIVEYSAKPRQLPEPSALVLTGLAILGLAACRSRRRSR